MRGKREGGFTLIELLVTIGIIGILASIAMPQYSSYRQSGFDARARADLRNAISAQEALYSDTESYASCSNQECNDPVLPGFHLSEGVQISFENIGDASYLGSANHPSGQKDFNFDSSEGLIREGAGGGAESGQESGIGG